MKNKFSQFKYLKNIHRHRGISKTRLNKIRLDANERISPIDNKFFTKIKNKINSNHLTTYPEIESLYDLTAKKHQLKRTNILFTSGSDIAMRHCFELFTKSRSKIITIDPTFGMVDVYAKIFNTKQIKIKFDNNLNLNLNKFLNLINKKVSMIMFANPNSPTGTIIDSKNIVKILKKAKKNKSYVIVDEAYFGFYAKSVSNLLKKFNNLVVLRTFSKAYGLAGVRAGYIISNKNIIEKLYKFRPMYEISSIAVLVVNEILRNNNILKRYVRETLLGKKYLLNELKKIHLSSHQTYANFLLVNFKSKKNQEKVFKHLYQKKILVRYPPNIKACQNHLRFTLGPKKYMKMLVKNLKKFKY